LNTVFALFAVSAVALASLAVSERLLERSIRLGKIRPPRMSMSITIEAPIERVWEYASDIHRQPEWMHEMKRVEMLTPGPIRVGSRGRATVRIFGISTTDDVVITRLEPPTAFGIRHEGRFTGEGLLLFGATPSGATRVDWMEHLRPPLFPTIGGFLQRPILAAIFRSDLGRLKASIESS
jgi:uncharacterized membrane protein